MLTKQNIALSANQSDQFAVSFMDGFTHIRGPVSESNLRQMNTVMISAAQSSRQPLLMRVEVCGLYTSPTAIDLPTQLLNNSKVTFPGTPGDRNGRKHESIAVGLQKRVKVAKLAASDSSKCTVM